MKTFAEFHKEKVLNEALIALPAIPYIIGGGKVLTDLAISLVVGKLGYDALTSDSVSQAKDLIKEGGTAIEPLIQASPETIVDAIAPHITSEGTVAATAESASAISSILSIPTQAVQSVLTYAAGFGLSTLDVCLIFGAGTVITAAGGYMFYKSNGPDKFKKLLKGAIEKIYKLLKLAGRVAISAFLLLGKTAAAAIATVWGWITGLISAGLTAIIKKVVSKKKEKSESDDSDESKSSQD